MGKAQKSNKEKKKQPSMTPQEKKALKKLKKDSKKTVHGSFWVWDEALIFIRIIKAEEKNQP